MSRPSTVLPLLLLLGPAASVSQAQVPSSTMAEAAAEAARRAPVARAAFLRARAVLDGWWTVRDAATGLLPRRTDQPLWAPQDNAADLWPFLVLTAWCTEPERLDDLRAMQRTEIERTTRLGALPDWYDLPRQRFLHDRADLARIVFGAAEYAKDGLNPLVELLGADPWSARMGQLLGGVLDRAAVPSDFGPLPSDSAEVCGDLLQALCRYHFLTGEERWLAAAERIGDAWCLEVLPANQGLPVHRWDFTAHAPRDGRLNLNDHGNEILGGLVELAIAARARRRPSAERYEAALRTCFDRLLATARNEDGLWVSVLEPATGKIVHAGVPDTWGYAFAALAAFGREIGETRYEEAARQALRGIHKDRYLEWNGADSFADSIEGALLLLNRYPEPEGYAWLDEVVPRFFAQQVLPAEGGNGIVEGWYGDGNYARTALMIAFHGTGGMRPDPWREELLLGAARDGEALVGVLSTASGEPWQGRLRFDGPRWREHFHLPWDYPRLNQFPEWFPVEAASLYRVRLEGAGDAASLLRSGAELRAGLPVDLPAGATLRLRVESAGRPPFGQEPGPSDPLAALASGGGDPALLAAADLDGGESYAGESYRWAGRGPIEWSWRSPEGPSDAVLWLRWGAKGDRRAGLVTIGTADPRALEGGGWDGWSWQAVNVPREWWDGPELRVRIEAMPGAGSSTPRPFVSSLRLRRLVPSAAAAPPPGALLEVEDFRGSWREQRNIPGYQGRGFRTSNARGVARDFLEQSVELPAGRYAVWARGYEGDGRDRSFRVEVDGHRLEPTHRDRDRQGFSWQFAGAVRLAGGRHTVRVLDAGDSFETADAISLTSDLGFDPEAPDRALTALRTPPADADPTAALIAECAAAAESAHARVAGHQADRASWEASREELRRAVRTSIGLEPPPPRTPLHARTTGVLERDGYRVEKVIFESRPGFPVTANLYLPAAAGSASGRRFPAVVCPVGHWGRSKAEPVVQARCIGLAKLGYVALVYDAFGQGERAVPGNGHDEYWRAVLAGWNNLSIVVWDTMRAVDYLLARPEVDGERIACTGASGGGMNTLYTAALDPRIRAAVPVVYVSRLREFLETRITHCPCSHANGLARVADLGDVLALAAPRPMRLLAATRDPMFTPEGARQAITQARPAFALYGATEDLDLRVFESGHDYNQPMREAMYGWLERCLRGRGDGSPLPEPKLAVEEDPSVLACFPGGRVPAAAETVRSLVRARAADLLAHPPTAPPRPAGPGSVPAAAPRPVDPGLAGLAARLGVADLGTPMRYATASGLELPAWRHAGRNPEGPLLVLLAGQPPPELLQRCIARASEVVGVDIRGPDADRDLHLRATDSMLLGESLLDRRAEALNEVLRSLRNELGQRRFLHVAAHGLRSGLTLLRAAGRARLADSLAFDALPDGFLDLLDQGVPSDCAAWRWCAAGDIPQLLEATGVPAWRTLPGGG